MQEANGDLSGSGSIDFVMAGGAAQGLGHVMRCAALASAASRRGVSCRGLLDGDRSAADAWRKAANSDQIESWSAWQRERAARVTFIDCPGPKSSWLSRLRGSRTRIVVLDDDRYQNEADLTVCPALHHRAAMNPQTAAYISADDDRKPNPARLLSGSDFAIVAAPHRATVGPALQHRTDLLLSMGGADPRQITPRIAPVLANVLQRSDGRHGLAHRHVVLGSAFEDPTGSIGRRLSAAGWQTHRDLDGPAMARVMSRAKLAIMGFGTSLTELAYHSTPHLFVTHHASDDQAATALEARGIGLHLGCAESLDLDGVATRFRQALDDEVWQQTSAAVAKQAIGEGRGVDRILDHISQWCRPQPAAPTKAEVLKGQHVPAS